MESSFSWSSSSSQPHVVMFPFPAQGHVNSMLKLAELLSLSDIRITFLNFNHIHDKLIRFTDIESRFSRFPNFHFQTISDGFQKFTFEKFYDLILSLKSVTAPLLKQMLISGELGQDLTCLIVDGLFNFIIDVNDEAMIPVFSFRTVSACCFWAYASIPKLIQDGQLPINGKEDMERIIEDVEGMENFLRCRDLPSFCRVQDPSADPILQFVVNQTLLSSKSHSLIFNTFEELEGPILTLIQSQFPNTYVVGPLHAHLKAKLSDEKTRSESESYNGLWEADRSCLAWLDAQPPRSVIYVSFGSVTVMGNHDLMEFWHGLVNSGRRFLWVIPPDLVAGKDGENSVPVEVDEATRERGCMVGWAPQEEVLSHEAIGGFLTHSGWNSSLESIAAGVPMICWPFAADQQINSRYVSEVWKIGMDMKDVCDREVVAKMVNDVMENKRGELMGNVEEMANLATKTVSQGGSSYCHFERLVKDIRLLSQRQ